MSENEKGYYIREFSNMTGLPQSKIRYYEKIGLFKVKRMKTATAGSARRMHSG